MATRRVTHRYASVVEFLEDHRATLGQGALLLPPDEAGDDLAPQVKLDLIVPPLGRLGPINAQVVNRAADGGVALRIVEWPPAVDKQISELLQSIDHIRQWLVDKGELFTAQQVADQSATAVQNAGPSASATADDGQPHAAPANRAPAAARGRGFPVPDLRGREPLRTGSCKPSELRKLFLDLAVDCSSGLVKLSYPDGVTRYGFWSNGGPVAFRTEPLDESEVLGVLLYKAEQISKEQLRESLDIMQQEGCRQGEAFIQMGLMSFPQLVMVLGKQVEFVLQRLLKQSEGTWSFHALNEMPERFLPSPLRVPALVFRNLVAQSRSMQGDAVYAALAPHLDHYVFLPKGSLEIVDELRFSAAEKRLIEIIRDNSWRMRELYAVSPMSRAVTASVMKALMELEFVEFTVKQADTRNFQRLQAIIDRKKLQLFSGNHFEILEVHWICLAEEVQAAYERLQEEYAPHHFLAMGPDVIADVETINGRLTEAHKMLLDDRSRREYRKEIVEEAKIVQSAELLGKQGDMAILRNDRRAATTCYGKALELVPSRPDFKAGWQRSRGLTG